MSQMSAAARVAGALPVPHGDSPARRSPDERWDAFMVAVAAYLLVGVGNITAVVPGLSLLRLGVLTVLAVVVLFVVDSKAPRRLRWVMDAGSKAVVLLLLWAVVTLPFALHKGIAFKAVNETFARTVLLYLALVACVRGLRDLERLFLVHLGGVTTYCAYTLLVARFHPADGRLEVEVGAYDANDFAAFAVTGAPLAVYFLKKTHPQWVRLLAVVGLVLITVGVVISGSRGGLLAYAAAALYVVFRYQAIPLRWRLGSVVLGLTVMMAIGSDAYWERMKTLLNVSEDYNVKEEVGRTQVWKRGVGYAIQRPINGVGIANFGWAEGTISPRARSQGDASGIQLIAPHNSFVQVLAELGFVGFGLLTFVIFQAFRAINSAERVVAPHDARAAPLAQALTAMLIGLLVGVFFLSHAYTALLYAMLAFAFAFGKVGRLMRRATRIHAQARSY